MQRTYLDFLGFLITTEKDRKFATVLQCSGWSKIWNDRGRNGITRNTQISLVQVLSNSHILVNLVSWRRLIVVSTSDTQSLRCGVGGIAYGYPGPPAWTPKKQASAFQMRSMLRGRRPEDQLLDAELLHQLQYISLIATDYEEPVKSCYSKFLPYVSPFLSVFILHRPSQTT